MDVLSFFFFFWSRLPSCLTSSPAFQGMKLAPSLSFFEVVYAVLPGHNPVSFLVVLNLGAILALFFPL